MVEIVQIDRCHASAPHVVETPLGNAANEGHSRAFEHAGGRPTGKLALALVATTRCFSFARAWAAADAHPLFVFANAAMHVVDVHCNDTPRKRSTSTWVRSCVNASMAALATLMGLVEPYT